MDSQHQQKRVGFVDYELDNFHANTFLAALRGPLAHRHYSVAGATAALGDRGRRWADKNGVPFFRTVSELAEHVDAFIVLAPSNPERHLEMCEQVLPYGKTTFVDKTFAPNLATAQMIFELAERHGAAVQSTSALRYSNVQQLVTSLGDVVQNLYLWAGGSSFAEYGVHPVELAVSSLGADVAELMCSGPDSHPLILMRYPDQRTAVIDFTVGVDVTYSAAITTVSATHFQSVDLTQLFVDTAEEILNFFDAGSPQIDKSETLMVRRILDAVALPAREQRFQAVAPAPRMPGRAKGIHVTHAHRITTKGCS